MLNPRSKTFVILFFIQAFTYFFVKETVYESVFVIIKAPFFAPNENRLVQEDYRGLQNEILQQQQQQQQQQIYNNKSCCDLGQRFFYVLHF